MPSQYADVPQPTATAYTTCLTGAFAFRSSYPAGTAPLRLYGGCLLVVPDLPPCLPTTQWAPRLDCTCLHNVLLTPWDNAMSAVRQPPDFWRSHCCRGQTMRTGRQQCNSYPSLPRTTSQTSTASSLLASISRYGCLFIALPSLPLLTPLTLHCLYFLPPVAAYKAGILSPLYDDIIYLHTASAFTRGELHQYVRMFCRGALRDRCFPADYLPISPTMLLILT